jgi:hypothetical protein
VADAPGPAVPPRERTWLFGWSVSAWNLITSAMLVAAIALQAVGIWQQNAERRELNRQLDVLIEKAKALNAR